MSSLLLIALFFYFKGSNITFFILFSIVIFFPYSDIAFFILLTSVFLIYYFVVISPKKKSLLYGLIPLISSFFYLLRENFFVENFFFLEIDSLSLNPIFSANTFFHNLFGYEILFLTLSFIGIYFSYHYIKRKSFLIIFLHLLSLGFSFFHSILFNCVFLVTGTILVSFLIYYIVYDFSFTSEDIKFVFIVLMLTLFLLSNKIFLENLENEIDETNSLNDISFDYIGDSIIISKPYFCDIIHKKGYNCIFKDSSDLIYLDPILKSNNYYVLLKSTETEKEIIFNLHDFNNVKSHGVFDMYHK
ncbi:MAG: hypothetical protein ACOCP4_00125 [Candidatus Woesearchaeota archaeon]